MQLRQAGTESLHNLVILLNEGIIVFSLCGFLTWCVDYIIKWHLYYIERISKQSSGTKKEGILPVATLSTALYVSCRSRSDSNVAPEVTKLSSPL